jgi:hypothetical protein
MAKVSGQTFQKLYEYMMATKQRGMSNTASHQGNTR